MTARFVRTSVTSSSRYEPDLDAGDEEALTALAVLGEVDQLGPEPHRVQRAEVPGGGNTIL